MNSPFSPKSCDFLSVNFVDYDESFSYFGNNFKYEKGYVLVEREKKQYFFVALGISTSDPERVDAASSFLVCYIIPIMETSNQNCPIEFWDTYWIYYKERQMHAFIPTKKGRVIEPETEEYRSGLGFKIPDYFNLREMLQGVTSHTIDRNNNVSVNCKEGSIWSGYWNVFEPYCKNICITIPPKPPLMKANEIEGMILQKESDIQLIQKKVAQLQRDMDLLKKQQDKLKKDLALINKFNK